MKGPPRVTEPFGNSSPKASQGYQSDAGNWLREGHSKDEFGTRQNGWPHPMGSGEAGVGSTSVNNTILPTCGEALVAQMRQSTAQSGLPAPRQGT
jgi:hypothetical protein